MRLAEAVLVAQIEFLEWTGDDHLRHSRFVGLREDKKATDLVRSDGRGPDASATTVALPIILPSYFHPS